MGAWGSSWGTSWGLTWGGEAVPARGGSSKPKSYKPFTRKVRSLAEIVEADRPIEERVSPLRATDSADEQQKRRQRQDSAKAGPNPARDFLKRQAAYEAEIAAQRQRDALEAAETERVQKIEAARLEAERLAEEQLRDDLLIVLLLAA